MRYLISPLKHIFDYSGRLRRKDYWISYFVLLAAFFIALVTVDLLICWISGVPFESKKNVDPTSILGIYMFLSMITLILTILSMSVRRLHDLGKSGEYMFVGLIPFIGGFWLIILMISQGQHGVNQYGHDPIIGEL